MTTLQPGSHGPEVTALQNALVQQGYYLGQVDGHFGDRTAAAVVYFQSCNNLTIDALAGHQVYQYLNLNQTPGGVEMTLPAPDAVSGSTYSITVAASHDVDLRVVVWFRAGSVEEHAVQAVHVGAGSPATATVQIPDTVRAHENEVHVTALAFPSSGSEQLDEKAGHFWLNRS